MEFQYLGKTGPATASAMAEELTDRTSVWSKPVGQTYVAEVWLSGLRCRQPTGVKPEAQFSDLHEDRQC